VRIGFTSQFFSGDSTFAPCQLRVMCRKKGSTSRLSGLAESAYPIGYLKGSNEVKMTPMNERITPTTPQGGQGPAWMDFVFCIPKDYEPVAAGLKANAFAAIPPMVSANEAPKESGPASESEKQATPQGASTGK